jgi:hypothetical protein
MTDPDRDDRDDAVDKRLVRAGIVALPVVTIGAAIVGGALQGPPAVLLALAGGALVAVIAIFWSSVRTLVGEAPLTGADAFALATPRAEEEQKRAVLRALKDLEFERGVGKISEEDFRALTAKYRAQAKRLLKALDEDAEPRRELVETLVQRRLRKEGFGAGDAESAEESASKAPLRKSKKRDKAKLDDDASDETTMRACAKCGTKNDEDAVFCKKCGARQAPEAEPEAKDAVAPEAATEQEDAS